VYYLLIFATALLADLLAGLHIVALARRRLALAMFTGPLPLLLGSVGLNFYVEASGRWERFVIILCEVVAILAAVPLTYWLTRRGRKVKKGCKVKRQRVTS
jgi:hypothetical protein